MSILIVDDNEINGILLEQMLRVHQYTSVRVTSGAAALKILRERMDIRLVIADILMPEMNGLELLREIKGSFLLKEIPVIMCTSLADIGQVRLAAAFGCASYLLKPVNRELLGQKVAQALGKTKAVLGTAEEIMIQQGIDKKTYDEVVRSFLDLLATEITTLQARLSCQAGAQSQLRRVAESAAFLGAKKLEARILDTLQGNENKGDMKLDLLHVLRDMQHVSSVLRTRENMPDPEAKQEPSGAAPQAPPQT